LHTDLYAPVLLKTGDSIYFDSGMAHAYIAATDSLCRVLSICSASEVQLSRHPLVQFLQETRS
jgi:quercetin dioxygenase-like cupin family protein